MRLVCPNCEAKYEVPEDAIPETGRDVQCANCGHAWFQMRTRAPLAQPEPTVSVPVVAASAPAEVAAEVSRETEMAPQPKADPKPEPVPEVPGPEADVAKVPVEPLAEAEVAAGPVEPEEAVVDDVTVAEIVAASDAEPADEPENMWSVAEDTAEVAADVSAEDAAEVALAEALETAAGENVVMASTTVETLVGQAAEPTMEAAPADDPESETETETDSEPATVGAAPYAVDESVLAILREEAEREVQARRVEARPLEVQTDLGIDGAVPAAQKAVAASGPDLSVMAAMGAGHDEAEARPSARRDLLPNVEEINSTLRPSDHPAEDGSESEGSAPYVDARSSFRSGFLLVMTITILASALYMSADALSAAIPALAGPLDAFVSFVDALRLRLDGLMQNATVAINGSGT